MEINREVLLRIVKATRASMRMAEDMRALLVRNNGSTCADEIYGHLVDAVFLISGEVLRPGQSFDDSNTVRILKSDMDDRSCADWFLMMDKIRKHIGEPEEVWQPVPQTIDPEELAKLRKQNGGYGFCIPTDNGGVKPVERRQMPGKEPPR